MCKIIKNPVVKKICFVLSLLIALSAAFLMINYSIRTPEKVDAVLISELEKYDKAEMAEKLDSARYDYLIEESLISGLGNAGKGLPADIPKSVTAEFKLVNAITVKQTLVDADYTPEHYTLDDVMLKVPAVDIEAFMDMFITMNSTIVPVYDVDPDSNYYVAYIDTMLGDRNNSIQDWIVAYNDYDGRGIDDAWVDTETGIIYITKDVYESEKETYNTDNELINAVQVQLLQRVGRGEEAASSYELIDMTGKGEAVKGTYESAIFNFETSVITTKNLNPAAIKLTVNGHEMGNDAEHTSYIYDPDTGVIKINLAPTTIKSIVVDTDNERISNPVKESPFVSLMSPFQPINVASATGFKWNHNEFLIADSISKISSGNRGSFSKSATYTESNPPSKYIAPFGTLNTDRSNYGGQTIYSLMLNISTGNDSYLKDSNKLDTSGLQIIGNNPYIFLNLKNTDIGGLRITDGKPSATVRLECTHITTIAGTETGINPPHGRVVYKYFNVDTENGRAILGLTSIGKTDSGDIINSQPGYGLFIVNFGEPEGFVEVLKLNRETGESQQGAEFVIRNGLAQNDMAKDAVVDRFTTGANGRGKSGPLKPGDYYMLEVTYPDDMDSGIIVEIHFRIGADGKTIYTQYLENHIPQPLEVTGNVIKIYNKKESIPSNIRILKLDRSSNSGLGGAVFTVYDAATGSPVAPPATQTITTNSSGYGEGVEYDPGSYYMIETQQPEGCESETVRINFTIDNDGNVTYTSYIINGIGRSDLLSLLVSGNTITVNNTKLIPDPVVTFDVEIPQFRIDVNKRDSEYGDAPIGGLWLDAGFELYLNNGGSVSPSYLSANQYGTTNDARVIPWPSAYDIPTWDESAIKEALLTGATWDSGEVTAELNIREVRVPDSYYGPDRNKIIRFGFRIIMEPDKSLEEIEAEMAAALEAGIDNYVPVVKGIPKYTVRINGSTVESGATDLDNPYRVSTEEFYNDPHKGDLIFYKMFEDDLDPFNNNGSSSWESGTVPISHVRQTQTNTAPGFRE